MTTKIDEQKVTKFTESLFSLIDNINLFPISLVSRESTPTCLEKYPRLLFGFFRRYDNVDVAFNEWSSKLLRAVDNKKIWEERMLDLMNLKNWCIENRSLFEGPNKKIYLQHLRGSLFARLYQYLYPKRMICMTVSKHIKQEYLIPKGASDDQLKKELKEIIETDETFKKIMTKLEEVELKELKGIFNDWNERVKDARKFLLSRVFYYAKIIKDENKYIKDEQNQLKLENNKNENE